MLPSLWIIYHFWSSVSTKPGKETSRVTTASQCYWHTDRSLDFWKLEINTQRVAPPQNTNKMPEKTYKPMRIIFFSLAVLKRLIVNFLSLISVLCFSNYSPFASRSPENMGFFSSTAENSYPLVQGDQVQGLIKFLTPIFVTHQMVQQNSLYV